MTKRKKSAKPPANATNVDGSQAKNTNEDSLAALESKPDESALDSQSGTSKQKGNRVVSWTGGSWRGKATAVAEIARESIPGSTSFEKSAAAGIARDTSQRLSQGFNSLGKASPSIGSATRLTVTSGTTDGASEDREAVAEKDKTMQQAKSEDAEAESKEEKPVSQDESEETALKERPPPAAGWLGWWSRRDETVESDKPPKDAKASTMDTSKLNIPKASAASTVAPEPHAIDNTQKSAQEHQSIPKPSVTQTSTIVQPSRTSWFGLLGAGSNNGVIEYQGIRAPGTKSDPAQPSAAKPPDIAEAPKTTSTDNAQNANAPSSETQKSSENNATSSSWAFWSRQAPKSEATTNSQTEGKAQIGELAVSGTDSQFKPMAALIGQEVKAAATALSKKRDGPMTTEVSSPKRAAKDKEKKSQTASKSEASSESEVPASMQDSVLKTTVEAPKKAKRPAAKTQPNLVLPAFDNTYRPMSVLSYWSKLSWVWGQGQSKHPSHLSIAGSPHRPKRALAIGIHGLVPTAMVQKILGPPTGTSIRFADGAAEAIRKITQARGYSCEIEKVALEGEGLIAERVDSLWKLLLNWIDQIRKADFIFIACHSQGVPVAISIVARLLNFGCVASSARLGICAMAGVSLGPFPSYQSRFLGSTATELFSLSDPASAVSQSYSSALSTILAHNVRILYIGSIDDQLVSLSSATHAAAHHPYIYRAVFVDGRIHAPDFLTHLVGFALKLRNLGVADHGLVRELSGPLAGSLYTGEGHSRIYEEQDVYELGVRHALDTETLGSGANPALEVKGYETPASGSGAANPYFLPWAMRGVLEEEVVRTELKGETDELLGLFERWKPTSKVLKDVKFRLEAVKSKL